ncbi:MAG: tetratricopeptide repeat protein [Bryobacteraceae bacterium]|nr:tetratricopeptide repeat protein [Bryobacteraceae bacterium]
MSNEIENLLTLAALGRRENRLDDARGYLLEAVKISRRDELADLARSLTGLGQIERDRLRMDLARQHYEEATAIYRAEGDALRLAHTIRHLGDIHLDEQRPALAEPCYVEALSIYRNHEDSAPLDLANAIRGFALLKQNVGEIEDAKSLWEEARDLYSAVHVDAGVRESTRRLALLNGTGT